MFKKYVGMVSGAIQKYVDNNLAKCPFCGEQPDWHAASDVNIRSSYQFRCPKCGAVISVPTVSIVNPFKMMPENITVVTCGSVNGNNLYPNTEYSLQFLISSGLKLADTNQIKTDLTSDTLLMPSLAKQSATEKTPPAPKWKKGRTVITVLLCLILTCSVAGALYSICTYAPRSSLHAFNPIEITAISQ